MMLLYSLDCTVTINNPSPFGGFFIGGHMKDTEIIAKQIEQGYFEGLAPGWRIFIDKPQFLEDIADLIRQGYTEGRLPCNWRLEKDWR